MCLYPKLIENRKYKLNKKNGGNIPPITDERTKYVPIGCQECIECRKQKARGWQVRMLEEVRTNMTGKFITLTFSDKSIKKLHDKVMEDVEELGEGEKPTGYDLDNRIATKGIRYFLENWRKEYGKSVRHWLITELGHKGTENIHVHGIIWTEKTVEDIARKWEYGWVWKGIGFANKKGIITYQNYVSEKTVNYITKYITKVDEKNTGFRGKIHCSKGIGNGYTSRYDARNNQYKGTETREYYRTKTGHKISLPTYYRNKIYTEKEREKLWLQKLDKEERWIMGEKVPVKNGDDRAYINILTYYRQRNTELKYGTGYRSQEQIEYNKQRRNLMLLTRIEKAKKKAS